MTSKLLELGYDGADIHHFYSFFMMDKIIVKDPSGCNKESIERQQGAQKALKLLVGGDKFYINQAISYGATGLDYTLIKFKTKKEQ